MGSHSTKFHVFIAMASEVYTMIVVQEEELSSVIMKMY